MFKSSKEEIILPEQYTSEQTLTKHLVFVCFSGKNLETIDSEGSSTASATVI